MDLVLMYHRIANDDSACSPAVSRDHFDQQLEVLQGSAEPVSLVQVVRERSAARARLRVAITFDDGYANNFTTAWPILRRRGWGATFFIVSGYVGEQREFWRDELEWLLIHGSSGTCVLDVEIAGQRRVWHLGARDGDDASDRRQQAYRELHAQLKPLDREAQRTVLDRVAASLGLTAQPRLERLPMDREHVRLLASEEFAEIGAHTVAHLLLPAFPRAVQEAQIRGSKSDLEEMTGRTVSSFAYPYGRRSPEAAALLDEAGFQLACTVANKPVGLEDRFRIPRLCPGDWDGDAFARRLDRIVRHTW